MFASSDGDGEGEVKIVFLAQFVFFREFPFFFCEITISRKGQGSRVINTF